MLSDLYRWSRGFVLSACVLYLAAGVLHAQDGAASIAGAVLDVAGKGIPGAAVSVRNDSNGSLKMVATDQEGKFSVSGLGEGTYSVEASAPSFTTSRRAGLKLAAGASQNVSLTLNVGELAQSITVEGTVSLAGDFAIAKYPGSAFRKVRDQSGVYSEFCLAGRGLYRAAPNVARDVQRKSEWRGPRR